MSWLGALTPLNRRDSPWRRGNIAPVWLGIDELEPLLPGVPWFAFPGFFPATLRAVQGRGRRNGEREPGLAQSEARADREPSARLP